MSGEENTGEIKCKVILEVNSSNGNIEKKSSFTLVNCLNVIIIYKILITL